MRIAVLITCHNRAQSTVACLHSLFDSHLPEQASIQVFLVDDGSTDNTADVVAARFPKVHILSAAGNLYWGGGMRLAYDIAMQQPFDAYLWLNDDVLLFESTIAELLNIYLQHTDKTGEQPIVVGWTRDQLSMAPTYGGLISRSKLFPLSLMLKSYAAEAELCSTMNGNCVLIPSSVYQKIGNIDSDFPHLMGDIDFGFRANRAGVRIISCEYCAGTCTKNTPSNQEQRLPLTERVKVVFSEKKFPLAAWLKFTYRHGGVFWPAVFVSPYFKAIWGPKS